jgi:hypothetical protein
MKTVFIFNLCFCTEVLIILCPYCFQYGEIEEMNVCDNLGDHLVGNVYIKVSLFICVFHIAV